MKKTALLVVALAVLAGSLSWSNAPAQVANPPAKWEYKIVDGYLDEAGLNKLGDEGWELAAAISAVSGGGGTIRGANQTRSSTIDPVSTMVKLTFKRPKR